MRCSRCSPTARPQPLRRSRPPSSSLHSARRGYPCVGFLTMTAYSAYLRLIDAYRATARKHGYAIAVHGSLKRDIDLIAVPWVEHASTPRQLADAIYETHKRLFGSAHRSWTPHESPE